MFRLYDRHLGPDWHEHSGEARIWDGIENIDDGELWETHLALKTRLLDFVRTRAVEQAKQETEQDAATQRGEVVRGLHPRFAVLRAIDAAPP